jgi:hypothetical protein
VSLVLAGIMLFGREASLPPVPGAEGFDPSAQRAIAMSSASTGIMLVQVAIFVGFIVAAILFRRLFIRSGHVSDGVLSAGLGCCASSDRGCRTRSS